jgi:hypothetical protein
MRLIEVTYLTEPERMIRALERRPDVSRVEVVPDEVGPGARLYLYGPSAGREAAE